MVDAMRTKQSVLGIHGIHPANDGDASAIMDDDQYPMAVIQRVLTICRKRLGQSEKMQYREQSFISLERSDLPMRLASMP